MTAPSRCRIFVISLAAATDRRAAFARAAEGADIDWAFYDAHVGLAADLSYDPVKARRTRGRELRVEELGCYSSHVSLWRQLLADDVERYVILEDDVLVDWTVIREVAERDYEPWLNYMKLYYKKPVEVRIVKRHFLQRGRALVEPLRTAFGAQGYMIDKTAAARLSAYCRTVVRPVDDQMDRAWDHGVPTYCLFPFPLFERAVPSTIGSGRFDDEGAVPFRFGRLLDRLVDRLRRDAWQLRRRFQRHEG